MASLAGDAHDLHGAVRHLRHLEREQAAHQLLQYARFAGAEVVQIQFTLFAQLAEGVLVQHGADLTGLAVEDA